MAKLVVLSTPILLQDGVFKRTTITLEQARAMAAQADEVEVFVTHASPRLLGLEPAAERRVCQGYEKALVIRPLGRLPQGTELSVEELAQVPHEVVLVERVG